MHFCVFYRIFSIVYVYVGTFEVLPRNIVRIRPAFYRLTLFFGNGVHDVEIPGNVYIIGFLSSFVFGALWVVGVTPENMLVPTLHLGVIYPLFDTFFGKGCDCHPWQLLKNLVWHSEENLFESFLDFAVRQYFSERWFNRC